MKTAIEILILISSIIIILYITKLVQYGLNIYDYRTTVKNTNIASFGILIGAGELKNHSNWPCDETLYLSIFIGPFEIIFMVFINFSIRRRLW